MIIGSDSKRKLIFKSSPEVLFDISQKNEKKMDSEMGWSSLEPYKISIICHCTALSLVLLVSNFCGVLLYYKAGPKLLTLVVSGFCPKLNETVKFTLNSSYFT